MDEETTKTSLKKAGYRFVGESQDSAVKICEWTRKSLRGQGTCYKQKWYGIESHRCLQCSTSMACNTRCSYCWRSFSAFGAKKNNTDDPEEIMNGMIEQQRLLLSGFGGYPDIDMKKFKEAQNPMNFAISLIGESLFYDNLSSFLNIIKKNGGSSFLVTKGTLPKKLEKLDTLPTNLYISLCAPDKETFNNVDKPVVNDGWERQMRSLEFMKDVKCRTMIRMTVANGLNMKNPEGYAKLIHKAEPDFIEVKAYMHLGESQTRLPRTAMPYMKDVRDFAKKIADVTGYTYKDFFAPSRVALLKK